MKKVLVIAAHPDDEILGCGASIARYSNNGAQVSVLLLTGGISSRHTTIDQKVREDLKLIQKHAIQANGILGVKESDVIFLNHEDQKLDTIPFLQLVTEIKDVINKISPDVVFTHHGGDYNKDHRVSFEATLYATRISPGETAPSKLYTYEVLSSTERAFGTLGPFSPNTYLDVKETFDRKLKAMSVYETELKKSPHPRSLEGLTNLSRVRGAEIGVEHAESFYLVRSLE